MRSGTRDPLSKLASAMNRNAVTRGKGSGPYGANVTSRSGPAAPAKSGQSSQSLPPWFTPKPQLANQATPAPARYPTPQPEPYPQTKPKKRRKTRATGGRDNSNAGPTYAPP